MLKGNAHLEFRIIIIIIITTTTTSTMIIIFRTLELCLHKDAMEGIGDATADSLQHTPMVRPPGGTLRGSTGGMRNGDMKWIELFPPWPMVI